jgi:hypothetical protein
MPPTRSFGVPRKPFWSCQVRLTVRVRAAVSNPSLLLVVTVANLFSNYSHRQVPTPVTPRTSDFPAPVNFLAVPDPNT